METTTDGKVWTPVPYNNAPVTTGTLQGVWVFPQQQIEWIWTHTSEGSYVSGYLIKGLDKIIPQETL